MHVLNNSTADSVEAAMAEKKEEAVFESKCGWLLKQSGTTDTWKKRWVHLRKDGLIVARSQEGNKSKREPIEHLIAVHLQDEVLSILCPARSYHFKPLPDDVCAVVYNWLRPKRTKGKTESIREWYSVIDNLSQASYKLRQLLQYQQQQHSDTVTNMRADSVKARTDEKERFSATIERTKRGLDAVLALTELSRSANPSLVHADYVSRAYLGLLHSVKSKEPLPLASRFRKLVNDAIDADLMLYLDTLYRCTLEETFVVPAAFRDYPSVVELALRGRCSLIEAQEAAVFPITNKEHAKRQTVADLSRSRQLLHWKDDILNMPQCTQDDAEEKVEAKIKAIAGAIQSVCTDIDATVMAECISEHLTSTVANFACKTAAQLCFGVPGLILLKPSQDVEDIERASEIRVTDKGVTMSVFSTWWCVEDLSDTWMLERDFDPDNCFGVVDAAYTMSYLFSDFQSGVPPFPFISIRRRARRPERVSNRSTKEEEEEGNDVDKTPSIVAPLEALGLLSAEGMPVKSQSAIDLGAVERQSLLPARLESFFRTSSSSPAANRNSLRKSSSLSSQPRGWILPATD